MVTKITKEKLINVIELLSNKISYDDKDKIDVLKYTQSILNLSHAIITLNSVEKESSSY